MRPRFLLCGYATEFVLEPMVAVLQSRGYEASALDFDTHSLGPDVMPPGTGPLVIISSQHALLTASAYDAVLRKETGYEPPQLLRERLGAELLVYVPHDLLEPVVPQEVALLQVFDLFAAPDDRFWWAAAHVRTVEVGWARHIRPYPPVPPVPDGILFIAGEDWFAERGGVPFLLESLKQTLASGVAVKLARWPRNDAIHRELERSGAPMIDPAVPASALIEAAPLVASNVPSSVLAEAAAVGHRPMLVMDPGAEELYAGQLDALASIDVLVCRDHEFPDRAADAGIKHPRDASFDVDRLLAAIEDQLAERSAA